MSIGSYKGIKDFPNYYATEVEACYNNKPRYHTVYGFIWKFIGGDGE